MLHRRTHTCRVIDRRGGKDHAEALCSHRLDGLFGLFRRADIRLCVDRAAEPVKQIPPPDLVVECPAGALRVTRIQKRDIQHRRGAGDKPHERRFPGDLRRVQDPRCGGLVRQHAEFAPHPIHLAANLHGGFAAQRLKAVNFQKMQERLSCRNRQALSVFVVIAVFKHQIEELHIPPQIL